MTAALAVCALLVTVAAGRLLVKRYRPVLVLLGAGLLLVLIRVILRPVSYTHLTLPTICSV